MTKSTLRKVKNWCTVYKYISVLERKFALQRKCTTAANSCCRYRRYRSVVFGSMARFLTAGYLCYPDMPPSSGWKFRPITALGRANEDMQNATGEFLYIDLATFKNTNSNSNRSRK